MSSVKFVFDASALLAMFHDEPGADTVRDCLAAGGAVVSAVNFSEVAGKLDEYGQDVAALVGLFRDLGISVVAFDQDAALDAARLRRSTKAAGLSLGDRACVSLALRLQVPAVTADGQWSKLGLPHQILAVR
jgi:PIN domain nuclease of toxin-antitoxin system